MIFAAIVCQIREYLAAEKYAIAHCQTF